MAATTSTAAQRTDLEGFCLIWLDPRADSTPKNMSMQKQFRSIIHNFKAFQDEQNCRRFVEGKSYYDRIFFVVSGQLGRQLVPCIHQLRQVCSIYVYCQDKQTHEQWAKKFFKVRDVIVKLDELMNRIQSDYSQRQQSKLDEPFPVTFYQPDASGENEFFHSQILFDYLLQMKSLPADKSELVKLCSDEYQEDPNELRVIDEFARKYHPNQSLWWFTRKSFLPRLLTQALLLKNLDLLFLFGFFLHDIQELLQKNQCHSAIQVYRGQWLSIDELHMLKNNVGQCFSINTFLLATLNRAQVVSSLSSLPIGEDLLRVLFEIDADPRVQNQTAFAQIAHLTFSSAEQQVLFQLGSVFQIVDIRQEKKTSIWIVKIALASAKHKYDQTSLIPRGRILSDMGKLDDADKYFTRILNDLPKDHADVPQCHYLLGLTSFAKGNYDMSLHWFHLTLDVFAVDDPNFASTYYSIGCVYHKCSDHSKAITYYEEAVKVWQIVHEGTEPLEMAECLNNMGCLYERGKFYSTALAYHRRQLEIRERWQSCLGSTYNNIGNIYFRLGEYANALENYTYSFALKMKTLPLDDPSLVNTLMNIGLVYEEDKNFPEALRAYRRAAVLFENTYPPSHVCRIGIKEDIQRVSAMIKTTSSV